MIVKQFNTSASERFSCSVYVRSSEKGNILDDPGFYSGDIKEYLFRPQE